MKNPGFVHENDTTAEINRIAYQAIKVNTTFPNQMVSLC